MKKLLLFACAAVTAMSANAQFTKEQIVKERVANKMFSVTTEETTCTPNTNVAAAPALNDLAGNYVEDSYIEIHECSAATISVEGNKVKVAPSVSGNISIEGTYDAATGVVTLPQQDLGTYTDTRGTFSFQLWSIVQKADGYYYSSDPVTFDVDDNGAWSLNQAAYCIRISAFTPAEGSQYTEADMKGKNWTASWETRFMPINGAQKGFTMGNSTGKKWAEYNYPVAIEDLEYSVNVFNFSNMGCLGIDVNEDGTVSVAMGQPMMDLGLGDDEAAIYGKYLCVYGVDLEGQSMKSNNDKETTAGTISGNTITITEYFRINSLWDAEGSGYAENWYADGTTITLNEGNYLLGGTAGIDEVKPTLEERAKNAKTYNLMGQRVNQTTAKGLLIRDGKKYIKKY